MEITNEKEYEAAMAELEPIFLAEAGTPESERADELVVAISAWENVHFSIDEPVSAEEAIEFRRRMAAGELEDPGDVPEQSNIVTTPDDELNDLTLRMNIDNKPVAWRILTNIKPNEIQAVITNWDARTEEYTVESLVEYINSKSDYGFTAKLYTSPDPTAG